jgi:adenylate cyclase
VVAPKQPLIPIVLDKPSIAVLPFANLSDDPEQAYFSDGITEDLITDLSKLSGLFVISRNSVFLYKGKNVKPDQVGQDLGVRYLPEGSVRKGQPRASPLSSLMSLQVPSVGGTVRSGNARHLAVQDEVTHHISALQVKLTESEQQCCSGARRRRI